MNLIFFAVDIDIKTAALGVFRNIIYTLDELIYKLIIDLYDVFRWMCGARIIENDIFNELSVRIGFILGLIMFFYISFDIIQIILDPDKLNDKDKGPLNIIKKFLIVIVLLGTSRYIFDLMFNFQNILLASDDDKGSVIEKLLLPYEIKSKSFGRAISANFMAQFYQITDDVQDGDTLTNLDDYDYETCYDFAAQLPSVVATTASFDLGYECLNARYKKSEGENGKNPTKFYIDFNYLSLPVGIFVAWMLFIYCVSVGIRVIQLAILQIISPAAIICYLSPSQENTFTKWLKLYFSTYIDVFIRVAIIDFVVLLSGLILDQANSSAFWTSAPGAVPLGWTKFWIKVFMIMALLSFAKKAPDLIKQLLPANLSSGIGFGIDAKDYAGIGMVGRAAGTAAGIAVGGGVNAIAGGVDRAIMAKKLGKNAFLAGLSGAGGGLFRGIGHGFQNKGNFLKNIPAGFKAQHEADVKYEELIASGGSARGVLGSKVSEFFGETKGQYYQRVLANADQMDKFKSDMHAAADEIKEVQYLKNAAEEMTQFDNETSSNFSTRQQLMSSNYRAARKAAEALATGGDGRYTTEEIMSEEIMEEIEVDSKILGADGKPMKIKKKVGTGKYKFKTDENGNYVTQQVEHTVNIASDDDDRRWAESIRTVVAQADAYSTSHNVELYDPSKGTYVRVGKIKNSSQIGDASNLANSTRSYVNSRPDFPGSQANDAAAGVKSRSGKK